MQTFAARIRSIIADSFNHARRARRRKTSEPQRFRMEFLEDRVLLSSDPTLAAVVEELIESPGAEVLAWSDTESLDAAEEAGEEIAEKQPLFTYRDAYENTYGPFDYDTFVRAESSDVEEIAEVDEPLLELAALFTLDDSLLALDVPNTTADALTNNNGGATGTSAFTQSETTVIAFGNTVLVGFNDSGSAAGATGRFTGFSLSTDGGATFTDGGTLPANPGGDGGDPVLARNDATGRIYFATLSPALGTIQMFRSDTDGATWMLPVNATPGGIGEDKPWITVDNFAGAGNGNVYVVSRRFGGTAPGIYFFRSTDDGATFGPSGGTLMVAGSQGAFVSVGTDHSVYVFWWAGTSLQMRKSTDFGLSFGAPVTVATGLLPITGDLGLTGIRQGTAVASGFRSNQFPHAAVNPVNGSIYVTYNTDVPGTDKTDVFVVQSTDGGTTWSAPVRVNDDLTTTDQWQPTIAVSTDGTRLGVFYSSREEDPGNNFFKYYGRIASISGSTLTFGPSFAISDTPSLPEFGRDSLVNPIYMGDYNTAYATPGFFHLSWSDNRDDLAGGAGRKDPSVYYKAIDLGLAVRTTSPRIGAVVSSIPLLYEVNFSDAIDPATVDAADFRVDGVAADFVDVNSPTKLTFRYNSAPFAAQGLHTMTMAAGSILRSSDGDGLASFSGTFRYDATLLQVIATVPPVNGVFPLPTPFFYDVIFNEPVDPASVQTWDLALGGILGALVTDVTVLSGNTTARFTLSGVNAQGQLTANIMAGAILDSFGNPGGAFAGTYSVDIDTAPYPTPLDAKDPLGSLIYDPTISGFISFAGDVDKFTLNVDAGQTIALILTPASPFLQGRIEILDPNDVSLAVAIAPAAVGVIVGIEPIHTTVGGEYTFTVTGANGSVGGYTLQAIVNAAWEPEGRILGSTNNTLASTLPTINASDSGWIRGDGLHMATNNNYFVGQSPFGTLPQRNYFTYTLPATTAAIVGAELRLFNPTLGYNSPDPTETFTVFDVSATPAALDTNRLAGDATGIALFGDLGSGTIFGTKVVSAADNNTIVTIPLNAAAVAALNAAIGSTISFGGAITTLAGTAGQSMFGGTSGAPSDVRLVLQTASILDDSFITLSTPQASAERGAVLGQTDTATNYTAVAVPFEFEDISATGTLITPLTNQDNVAVLIPIGFAFPFYGTTNNAISVSSNGLLTFAGAVALSVNTDLTTTPSQATIAPFWDDLHTGGGVPGSNVFFQVIGSGMDQHLTVQWNNVRFLTGGVAGDTITFQAQLYADGRIQFNYRDLVSGTAPGNNGASATVGIKAIGTQGPNRLLPVFNNGPNAFVGTGQSTRIAVPTPTPDYYGFSLEAGETVTLAVTSQSLGNLTLELRNSADVVIATGVSAANVNSVISNFQVATGGTYYARINTNNGALGLPYSLVVTKNAAFDTENNSTAATAQVMTTEGALGAIVAGEAINAVDSGWLATDGTHLTANGNYVVGQQLFNTNPLSEFRNYSTFALPATISTIVGAELRLFNPPPGYNSPDSTETYTLFDVSTTPSELDAARVAGDAGGMAIHADLGSGTIYGSRIVSAADANTTVSIALNAAAIAALNAAIGSTISFGGAITTLAGTAQQTMFGFTSGVAGTVQLVLQTTASDWYSITLPGTANAVRLETSTPGDGPGEPINTFNPRIELYDVTGATLIASGVAVSDGRNESIVVTGLTPGATYKVRVRNEDTTSGEYFFTRNFNFSPVVTDLTVGSPISENDTASVNGAFTDLDSLDAHTVIINWGDGESSTLTLVPGVLTFSATHPYLDDNPTGTLSDVYTISVVVLDGHFGPGSGSVQLTVNNVAPVVTPVSGPSSGVRGQALDFSGLFSDVGTLDTHDVRWDFGDGTVIDFHSTDDPNALAVSHVYTTDGTHTLTLSIRDDDGSVTSVHKSIAVTAVSLQTDPCDPDKIALVIGGTTAGDSIVIGAQGNSGDVVVYINGTSQGIFRPTGHLIVYGQDGDDDIQISGSIGLEAWLFGDAGNDRLKSGAGAAILSGGDGDDFLNGGSGRSVLIGGRGEDRLVGASGDDILIGGSTVFDGSPLEFCALLEEWNSIDVYAVRVANLQFLLNASTVIDDEEVDMLTGSSGQDWFFFGVEDSVTRIQNEEVVG